ncbi:uncharacterized protein Fa2h [Calliphora vicina]|uniref:uncharacterized protein Fa2h n=1 Tax=Calliphora vicina TaxID=7373 RepID=UPI00325B3339
MAPNSELSTIDETPVQQMADSTDTQQFIVKYRKNYYDISEFLHKHPGGLNTLKGLQNADMTGRFMKAPPHSDAAMYLMQEYKIVTKSKNKLNGHVRTELKENIEIIEEYEHDDNNNSSSDKNSSGLIDESMEHLVDWSQAMLPQIPRITQYYDEWVHKPVDRPLRLFAPWYLEMCTKTPWWVVPTFWLPVISKLIYDEFINELQMQNTLKLTLLSLYFLTGILFWTFLEYTLHRYVFHMEVKPNTHPWLCTLHFMIHGLHHKVPFDPMRLVFPPLPGVIIASILYSPISLCLPRPRVILAGALFGYLCYDMIHYYLHYGNPSVKHLYHMKRYHYQHHFAHQDMGYGISSPLWDFVFNTSIHLRKLRYHLKWK